MAKASAKTVLPALQGRDWPSPASEQLIQALAAHTAGASELAIDERVQALIRRNLEIHDLECVNLNPATNVMNPKAEAVLAAGLGSRPSLGYPGDKYEMGLEAIEEIEVIAAELAAEIFAATHAEIRVASGAMANLYAFMATAKPGEAIIVPPPAIGGHVTHQRQGAAGLYGLDIHHAPIDAGSYTIDLEALRALARKVNPRLITIGGSLNLLPHPVRQVRAIADEIGAYVLFDAAHLCGLIAGGQWPNPLAEGAHMMSMSTYKSLGGPAGGLLLTIDADLARRIDAIAFPGMTANFDAAKSASLAITLLDWRAHGKAYGARMVENAAALAAALDGEGLSVFATRDGFTRSHQLALSAAPFGGGQKAARRLRLANILACGIGLPMAPVEGDLNGLRLGTPEITRRGMEPSHMGELARLVRRGLLESDPKAVAGETSAFRRRFQGLHFVRQ